MTGLRHVYKQIYALQLRSHIRNTSFDRMNNPMAPFVLMFMNEEEHVHTGHAHLTNLSFAYG